MTHEEIISNSGLLLVAGSETVATLLSGATYYLLRNPSILKRLQDEVRSAFNTENDINLESVGNSAHLPYMEAVLTESLRLYPPVPASLLRMTGPEGDVIDGNFIPPHVQFPPRQADGSSIDLAIDIRGRTPMGNLSLRCQFHRPRFLRPRTMAGRPTRAVPNR